MSKKPNRFGSNLNVDLDDPAALTSVGQTEQPRADDPPVEASETVATNTDLLAGLEASKPKAKSYSFYLSEGNANDLKKLARKNKTSVSKVLDTILTNYFNK
jgi:hypothetical protein